jgi:hypothetical protein
MMTVPLPPLPPLKVTPLLGPRLAPPPPPSPSVLSAVAGRRAGGDAAAAALGPAAARAAAAADRQRHRRERHRKRERAAERRPAVVGIGDLQRGAVPGVGDAVGEIAVPTVAVVVPLAPPESASAGRTVSDAAPEVAVPPPPAVAVAVIEKAVWEATERTAVVVVTI